MIYSDFEIDNARILIWEIAETEDELKSLLSNFAEYKTEFEAIKTIKRKLEFLTARIAINKAANQELKIQYDIHSKPYCSGNQLQISISHSSKWVAIMVHPTNQVGIDIEIPGFKFDKVYKRFLNEKEQTYLYNPADLSKTQLAWSAKEALYKIIGIEAVDFSKQLEINNFDIAKSGKFIGLHVQTQQEYKLYYQQESNFNLVYCISPYETNNQKNQ